MLIIKLVSFTNLHLQKEIINIEEFNSSKANQKIDVNLDDLEKYLRKIKYERKKINVKFDTAKEKIRLKRNMLFGSSKANYNKKKISNTISMRDDNEIDLNIKGSIPVYNMKQTINNSSDLISEKSIGVSINSDNEVISVESSSSSSSSNTSNLNSIDENPEIASQVDSLEKSIKV